MWNPNQKRATLTQTKQHSPHRYGTDDIVGRWYTERGIPRDRLFFLVKGAHPEGDPGVAPNRVTREAINEDVAKSLRELKVRRRRRARPRTYTT